MPFLIILALIFVIGWFAFAVIATFLLHAYELLVKAAFPIANLFNNILGIPMTQLTSVGILVDILFFLWGMIKCIKCFRSGEFERKFVGYGTRKLLRTAAMYLSILVAGLISWPYLNDYILMNVWDWHEYRFFGYWGFLLFTIGLGIEGSRAMVALLPFTPFGRKKRNYYEQKKEEAARIEAERRAEATRIRSIKEDNLKKLISQTTTEVIESYQRGYDSIFERAVSIGNSEGYNEGYNNGYREHC